MATLPSSSEESKITIVFTSVTRQKKFPSSKQHCPLSVQIQAPPNKVMLINQLHLSLPELDLVPVPPQLLLQRAPCVLAYVLAPAASVVPLHKRCFDLECCLCVLQISGREALN